MESVQEKIKLHKESFNEDPIHQYILERGLEDVLYEDINYFSEVSLAEYYSTKRAAALLGENSKEYKLTNLLARDQMKDYFQVFRKNDKSHYRYTWESIFRFKMVLLLMDHTNLTPSDVDDLVNSPVLMRQETVNQQDFRNNYKTSEFPSNIQSSPANFKGEKEIKEFKKYSLLVHRYIHLFKDINRLESLHSSIDNDMKNIERSKRYFRILELKKETDSVAKKKNKGFFAMMFGSKETVSEEAKASNIDEAVKEEVETLEAEQSALQKKKERIEEMIADKQLEVDSISKYIEQQHPETLQEATKVLGIESRMKTKEQEESTNESI